jgi:putative NAD(P)-binding protein
MKVLVLGSGLSGMAAALALGRRGHAVSVIERDATPPPTGAEAAFDAWQRPSIPQFRQPHNFLGLGRRILRERAPDVYQAVLAAGASEVEQFRFITDGSHEPDHEELVTLACRRPVFEAVLRRAVAEEDNVDMRIGCRVGGLAVSTGQSPARGRGGIGGRRASGGRSRGRCLRPGKPRLSLASGTRRWPGQRADLEVRRALPLEAWRDDATLRIRQRTQLAHPGCRGWPRIALD